MAFELTDRDRQVLAFLDRYTIATRRVLEEHPVFADGGKFAVKNVLQRLKTKGKLIRSEELSNGQRFYALTRAGQSIIDPDGSPPPRIPSGAKLISEYAMLLYCNRYQPSQERISPREFRGQYKSLYRPGEAIRYFVDVSAEYPRLGFLKVDAGGYGQWCRVVNRIVSDIKRRCSVSAFRELIRDGRFTYVLAVPTEQKANRIRVAIKEYAIDKRVKIDVVFMPELLPLIVPRRF